ncbi:MAG: GNAT family N-acetyltransferase [Deinococcales bacterium]
MTRYLESTDGITAGQLTGFFEGWRHPPSPATHLQALRGSDLVVLAIEDAPAPRVVAFATAITDGVLAAYIPLLEVLPTHRGRGIGGELLRRLLARLQPLYLVDRTCDAELLPFYRRLGFEPATAAAIRDVDVQGGREAPT